MTVQTDFSANDLGHRPPLIRTMILASEVRAKDRDNIRRVLVKCNGTRLNVLNIDFDT